jgi:hypothetical protein
VRRLAREAPVAPPAASLASRLRPWALPAVTVLIAFWLFRGAGSFDLAALREEFRDGEPEAALARLAATGKDELPAALAGVSMRWWPRAERARALSDLAAVPDSELLEDGRQPTLARPLDRLLQAPEELRLREPHDVPLLLTLTSTDMNLQVAALPVPPGTDRLAPGLPLLRGASYLMTLSDPADDAQLALAGFSIASEHDAQEVVAAMSTAHDLAGDSDEGARLLAALVALERGFHDEALVRLAPLRDRPGYERLATELTALALARQGLDLSARRLLAP